MTTEVLFTSVFVFRIHKGRAGHFRKFSSLNVILKSQKPRATKIEKTKTNPMKKRKNPKTRELGSQGKSLLRKYARQPGKMSRVSMQLGIYKSIMGTAHFTTSLNLGMLDMLKRAFTDPGNFEEAFIL